MYLETTILKKCLKQFHAEHKGLVYYWFNIIIDNAYYHYYFYYYYYYFYFVVVVVKGVGVASTEMQETTEPQTDNRITSLNCLNCEYIFIFFYR